MNPLICRLVVVFGILGAATPVLPAGAQTVTRDVPYATAHERQVLDIYSPAGARNAPVVFWIHGGGWQAGHKGLVALKPKAFNDAGFVFVSINHRLLPSVQMEAIVSDVASALGIAAGRGELEPAAAQGRWYPDALCSKMAAA